MGRTFAALTAAILACLIWTAAASAQAPAAADFQKVTLDDNTQNPMELDVAKDGRVFYIERDGRVQIWKPDTRDGRPPGTVPVTRSQENGLLGIALAPDFDDQQLGLPLLLAAAGQHAHAGHLALHGQRRHARPGLRAEDPHLPAPAHGVLPLVRLARTSARRQPLHLHGRQHQPVRLRRLQPDRRARRPRATGTPSARRPTRTTSAARSCASCRCETRPGRPASARRTRSRPATCSPSRGHDDKTLPEIFAMGFRNPFRLHGRPEDGLGADGRLRPGRRHDQPQPRPAGPRRVQRRHKAGQLRLAVLHPRQRRRTTTTTSRPTTSGAEVQLRRAGQQLAQQHRPDEPAAGQAGASAWMGYTETDPRFPDLGTGGAPTGGPRYHYDPNLDSDTQVPGLLRRQVVHRRVEQRLDQDRRPQRRRRRSRACRHCRASAPATSARWTWSSGPTARSTSSSGARASTATTPTRASTGSTTSRATRRPIAHAAAHADTGPRR